MNTIKIYIAIFVLVVPVLAYSQKNSFAVHQDSVKQLLLKDNRTTKEVEFLRREIDDAKVSQWTDLSHKFRVLSELKSEKEWETPSWKKYRVFYEGLQYFQQEKFEKAKILFIEYINLKDKEKGVMGIYDPLGEVRTLYRDQLEERLNFYLEKVKYYQKNGPVENVATCHHGIAGYYFVKGNYNSAIRYYLMASEGFRSWSLKYFANELAVVGNVYQTWGNDKKAKEYLEKAIPLLIQEENFEALYFSQIALVRILRSEKKQEECLSILLDTWNKFNYSAYDVVSYKATIPLEIANVYLDLNQPAKSLPYLQQSKINGDSINLTLTSKDQPYEIDFTFYRYYSQVNDEKRAEKSLLNALFNSINIEATPYTEKYLKELARFYYHQKNHPKSAEYFMKFTAISDSLRQGNNENIIAGYEIDKLDLEKNLEIKQVEQKRKTNLIYFGFIVLFLILFLGGLYSRIAYIRKSRNIIENEKKRSEELLLNILPFEVAEELKNEGVVSAKALNAVSVVFTDYVAFTELVEKMDSEELVDELNTCFSAFDNIVNQYGIEKIKTMGDSYMAAGGLIYEQHDAVANTVLAALDMQEFMIKRKQEFNQTNKSIFQMRVGVHTGPVVAGVVGFKKFQYDIWGDTVNIASRTEKVGEVGKVNISQTTYELIKNNPAFLFTERQKIKVKGKGFMKMYFVEKSD